MKFTGNKAARLGLVFSALVATGSAFAESAATDTGAKSAASQDSLPELVFTPKKTTTTAPAAVPAAAKTVAQPELTTKVRIEQVPRVAEPEHPVLSFNTYEETKVILERWAKEHDHVLKWNTDKTVRFENGMAYSGDFKKVLTDLAADIATLGIDLNFKVFQKNKVIVVYSVR